MKQVKAGYPRGPNQNWGRGEGTKQIEKRSRRTEAGKELGGEHA